MHTIRRHTSWILLTTFALGCGVASALPDQYQLWPAELKQKYLWNQVLEAEYPKLPTYGSLGCKHILRSIAAIVNLRPTVHRTSDEMPEGRVKAIHTFGSVVPVVFEPAKSSPYTGLFSGGPVRGLARFSLAIPEFGGFVPGMGLKLLIDRHVSVNILAMHSVSPQKGRNVFSEIFSNWVPGPTNLAEKLLQWRFRSVAEEPSQISLARAAAIHTDGSEEEDPNVPGQLLFVPTEQAASYTDPDSKADFRTDLGKIPSGTMLYMVFAVEGESRVPVGSIYTTDRFVASKYGDQKLFFHHPSDTLKD